MRSKNISWAALSVAVALLVPILASASSPHQVKIQEEIDEDVDLHELCESLARQCWDLDPADFGMTPAHALLPPTPESVHVNQSAGGEVTVHVRVLGQHLMIKGNVSMLPGVSHDREEEPDEAAVPCRDQRGCPDLQVSESQLRASVVRDKRTFGADHCAVQENSTEAGERKLLRFTFNSPNLGPGDLVVGAPEDHLEWFEWGECHGHWHFREYADYRLWTPTGYAAWSALRATHPDARAEEILEAFPEIRNEFVSGHKQGFCVIDLRPGAPVVVETRKYLSCESNQGISAGWSDEYHRFLDGQWIDVTDVEPGAYVLEAEVNAERLYVEALYADNSAATLVEVS